MHIVIYRGPEVGCLASRPVGRGGFTASAGAHLDLDEVIGTDRFTVADALGSLIDYCTPADQPVTATYDGLPAEESEE